MMRMPFPKKDLNCLLQMRHSEFECQKLSTKKARPLVGNGPSVIGVAVTYFRMRMHTIIGANPFHGPVRDGKAWFQVAIAAT